MVSVDGLTVEFSGTTLFKDISFVINDKDRIALMGKNGAGKSTMLKILAGVKTPNRGKVTVTDGGKIGYLPQHLMVENGRTVFEEACLAFEHLFEIEREIESINNELTVLTDYDSEEYIGLIEPYKLSGRCGAHTYGTWICAKRFAEADKRVLRRMENAN